MTQEKEIRFAIEDLYSAYIFYKLIKDEQGYTIITFHTQYDKYIEDTLVESDRITNDNEFEQYWNAILNKLTAKSVSLQEFSEKINPFYQQYQQRLLQLQKTFAKL